MAVQDFITRLFSRSRRASHTVAATLLGLSLVGLCATGLRYAGASAAKAPAAVLEINALPTAQNNDDGAVVGEFEGVFEPTTRQLTLLPARNGQNVRANPNGQVTPGSGFTLTVVNSTFIGTGALAGTISGEVRVANNTTQTLYNTRIVFTRFRLCPASGTCNGTNATTDAGSTPGATGFAYYNDGQLPHEDRLNVSRDYGDIAASASSNRVWTFAVSTTPPRFFFAYAVLADIGVAAESVKPAAVQVNANSGNTVKIKGRGFSGTPTVELLNPNGSAAGAFTSVTATATEITATVPTGTAAGIYGVRVTNPGGTPGAAGSSTLIGRLTVTAAPAQTLSGAVTTLSGAGPYAVTADITIGASLTVPPGTVFYLASGVNVTVQGGGTIVADGGIPGVSTTSPAQIVFTAQRSPGAALPTPGFWGVIDAEATAAATLTLKNVVVEYGGGGATSKAQIHLGNAGRTLRFTDGIVRCSGRVGVDVSGVNSRLTGFSRNRIDENGVAPNTPSLLLAGDAAVGPNAGLYELNSANANTSVGDANFYYSAANVFEGNQVNAVQIGTDADAASNDFTRSGVLVGQGATPINIRGSASNPAIVGAAAPAQAELSISATALIQLAAGTDLQAGDFATNRIGGIAANGFAGVYQAAGQSSAAPDGNGGAAFKAVADINQQTPSSAQLIIFDRIPGGGNFGAIFFSRLATPSSILNFVVVRNGGQSGQGNGAVIAEGVTVQVRNSQVTNSSTGGIIEINGGIIDGRGTSSSNTTPIIDTIAGGLFGEGDLGIRTTIAMPVLTAADPMGRGIYIIDNTSASKVLLRFFNVTRNSVTLANVRIAAGTIRAIAGGGIDLADNVPALLADLGNVQGLAVSPDGGQVYFIDSGGSAVRAVNVSTATVSIGGANVNPSRVGTVSATGFGSALNGLSVDSNGNIYVVDATGGVNKIFRLMPTGGQPVVVAGNGSGTTRSNDAFSPGQATNIPLLTPRAAIPDGAGGLYIADTGHGRVIRVNTAGQASLVVQWTPDIRTTMPPYQRPPNPSGLALFGGKLYIANGNSQDIIRMDDTTPVRIAGGIEMTCEYTASSSCGDGGPAAQARFSLVGSTGSPPIAAIAADARGIYVADQASSQRGRIRFINLSAGEVAFSGVTFSGITIGPNNINTIAGTGLIKPFDGPATSAELNGPCGMGVDPNGNLWITESLSSKIRFVNRGTTTMKIFAGTPSEQTVAAGAIVTVNRDVGVGDTDGVPVISAGFSAPQGVVATQLGVFIVDSIKGQSIPMPISRKTSLVRFINTGSQPATLYSGAAAITIPAGNIATIGGGSISSAASVGDGTEPLNAKFIGASDIAVAANGDLFVADVGNKRVRKITRASGVVSSQMLPGAATPGVATSAPNAYTGIALDPQGRLLVVDHGTNSILREKSPGSGNNANGFDVLLTGAPLNRPRDIVVDATGNTAYVTNAGDHRILRLTISGATATASVFAGTTVGYSGDLGPANAAQVDFSSEPLVISFIVAPVTVPYTVGITSGLNGEIIFADTRNAAIRRIR